MDAILDMKSFKENIILQENYRDLQSRESREIFGETETMKMATRRDQSRGLESWLQPLEYLPGKSLKIHCY